MRRRDEETMMERGKRRKLTCILFNIACCVNPHSVKWGTHKQPDIALRAVDIACT